LAHHLLQVLVVQEFLQEQEQEQEQVTIQVLAVQVQVLALRQELVPLRV
jgi:hypothetical protein